MSNQQETKQSRRTIRTRQDGWDGGGREKGGGVSREEGKDKRREEGVGQEIIST